MVHQFSRDCDVHLHKYTLTHNQYGIYRTNRDKVINSKRCVAINVWQFCFIWHLFDFVRCRHRRRRSFHREWKDCWTFYVQNLSWVRNSHELNVRKCVCVCVCMSVCSQFPSLVRLITVHFEFHCLAKIYACLYSVNPVTCKLSTWHHPIWSGASLCVCVCTYDAYVSVIFVFIVTSWTRRFHCSFSYLFILYLLW